MDGHSDEVDPFSVGVSFTQAYYDVLSREAEALCKFYSAHSSFTFSEGDTSANVQTGPAEIKQRINELGLSDVKTDVRSIDCQLSWRGSVLVVVHGILYCGREVPKRFSQTFLLVKPKPTAKNFYVANSAFRYISEFYGDEDLPAKADDQEECLPNGDAEGWVESTYEAEPEAEPEEPEPEPEAEPEPEPEATPESAAWPAAAEEEASTNEWAGKGVEEETAADADVEAEEAEASEDREASEQVDKIVEDEPEEEEEPPQAAVQPPPAVPTPQPHPEPTPAPTKEPEAPRKAPTNYAEALSWGKKPKPAPQQFRAPIVGGTTTTQTTPVTVPPASPPRPREARPEGGGKGKGQRDGPPSRDVERHSIYVAKLPADIDDAELKEVFSHFGVVTNVRNRPQKKIAFLDFSTAEAQTKAVDAADAGTLLVRGAAVVVQRESTAGPGGDGGRPGGKGKGKGKGGAGYTFGTPEGEKEAATGMGSVAVPAAGRGKGGKGKGGRRAE